ncbi:MAG: mreD [Parachlamydiaceae bacterium]|nr:mreD [Parachlamydiaceae bacterium]
MNLERKRIDCALIVTLAAVLCAPVLIPTWPLMFFAPFLIILFYQKSYIACLWASLTAGLVLDLMSSQTHFGLYATSYVATAALLYKQRYNFFADRISTLPLMTFFFSVLATLLQIALIYAFEQKAGGISWHWLLTDLVAMPLLDAGFGFFFFVLPLLLFGRRVRLGKEYFSE